MMSRAIAFIWHETPALVLSYLCITNEYYTASVLLAVYLVIMGYVEHETNKQ